MNHAQVIHFIYFLFTYKDLDDCGFGVSSFDMMFALVRDFQRYLRTVFLNVFMYFSRILLSITTHPHGRNAFLGTVYLWPFTTQIMEWKVI